MKVLEILNEVDLLHGLESKKIDISHWHPEIKDAYVITLNDGRKTIRYDLGSAINLEITQWRNESYADFRQRVKGDILQKAKWDKDMKAADERRARGESPPPSTKDPHRRFYLNIPFNDKEIAKRQFFARWDPVKKKWWMPAYRVEENRARIERLGWL